MTAVLGIDAAWSAKNPSGVALIKTKDDGRWEFVDVAPSYDSFIALADGIPIDWGDRLTGGNLAARINQLLTTATELLGGERVTVIAVDMPLSREPIQGRRVADDAISREFGGRGCGTHSPTVMGSGIADRLCHILADLGYPLAVNRPDGAPLEYPATIEVYPHPALLCLLNRDYRLPYKVGKSRRYWPKASPRERIEALVAGFWEIKSGLAGEILRITDFLPASPYAGSRNHLKRYEDALDALVCAWVGALYLAGCATAYGDDTAAIWVPNCRANA